MSRTILVSDLMTKDPVALHLGATLADAERIMRTAAVRHLPITDSVGKLAGLITHRTLLGAWVSHGDPTHERHEDVARDVPIEMVMERTLVTIAADASAAQAARMLIERRIGCLPVTDGEARLVGIVTEADFVEFARIYLEHASPSS